MTAANPTEYLLARYAEEEREARESVTVETRFADAGCEITYGWARHTKHPSGGQGVGFMPGAPSPQHVLADIAAKRAIVGMHEPYRWIVGLGCRVCIASDLTPFPDYPCPTLLALLQPYAGRPDFDPSWRRGAR